ncbi:MAG: efflux RND transporter periplasmic adaptor subunit [Planctomycetota bacterium]|nr:efflux RND transporter periplasmic adaptor subunit [Planctomycetota bacterium]
MSEAPDLQSLRIDRTPSARKRPGPWKGRVVWLAVLLIGGWLFQRPMMGLVDRLRLVEVEITSVVRRSPSQDAGSEGAAANGYVVARTRAALSADRPGRLVEVNVVEGSRVSKGDVVARLDHEEQDAAVGRSRADLEVARRGVERAAATTARALADEGRLDGSVNSVAAQLDEAQAQLDFAREAEVRYEELLRQGIVQVERRDEAVRDRRAAEARANSAAALLAGARSTLKVAQADIEVARRTQAEFEARAMSSESELDQVLASLEKTFVRAPFDGVVVSKEAEVGEVVSPNSQGGSNARGSVATMVDFGSLEAQAEVPETSLAAVRLGAPARIYLDAFPGEPYLGRIDRIWPAADRQKATVEVRVAFDELDERLRPQMGCRVVFLSEGAAAQEGPVKLVLLVPATALVKQGQASAVFVVERDRVRMQEVDVGATRGNRVIIETGLTGEEEIVVTPPVELEDGQRVRVVR